MLARTKERKEGKEKIVKERKERREVVRKKMKGGREGEKKEEERKIQVTYN